MMRTASIGALILVIVAITLVNFIYLLLQIVVAADDCSVPTAVRRVTVFLRRKRRDVLAVFFVVLALVIGGWVGYARLARGQALKLREVVRKSGKVFARYKPFG